MKRIHLLSWGGREDELAELYQAASEAGLRLGWIDWQPSRPLSDVVAEGPWRRVEIGAGGEVTTKVRKGRAVLQDVLREHFLGCGAVLIRSWGQDLDALGPIPQLELVGGGRYRVRGAGLGFSGTAEELLRRLRSPAPWAI